MIPFETLKGQTITQIDGLNAGSGSVVFRTASGQAFELYHEQDCCEVVQVEEVWGDPGDLLNFEVLLAMESLGEDPRGSTWTFYRLATIKGDVTIRWLGESNGFYSESVSFRTVA